VLEVHLDGYRHVLAAALPIMAAAGHGRILGVTSGSGWRPADAGAFSGRNRRARAVDPGTGRAQDRGAVRVHRSRRRTTPRALARRAAAAVRRTRATVRIGANPVRT